MNRAKIIDRYDELATQLDEITVQIDAANVAGDDRLLRRLETEWDRLLAERGMLRLQLAASA